MPNLKTQENEGDVRAFIATIENEQRRSDALQLLELMQTATQAPARMWGGSIIGFGRYDLRYADGHTQPWLRVGFSPRKSNLALYLMDDFAGYEDLMPQLGPHKTGKSCLYITRLSRVDLDILARIIQRAYASKAA